MNIQNWPKDTKQLPLSELFTDGQMVELIILNTKVVGSPAKSFLKYIKDRPDVLDKCAKHNALPEYLAYYIEFVLNSVRG